MRSRVRAIVWTRTIGLAALAAAAGGCQLNLRPGAATLTEALMEPGSTPLEQTQMATNPYDANERYLGTLGLANQDFASEPVYIRLFETNIRDADPMVRSAAIRGLANHGEPRHVAMIVPSLADANPLVRAEAARSLQRLHHEDAVAPLIAAVREPDVQTRTVEAEPEAHIRAEAATALGQYAEHRVLRALIAALDDSDLAVNRAAQASLRTLTGQDFGIDRVLWQAWESSAEDPFAGRQLYTYPAYSRRQRVYEYIPLVPKPPNERPGPPAGMPR